MIRFMILNLIILCRSIKKCEFCKCTLIMKLNYYKYINYMIQIYYYAKLIYASIENILINCKNVLI